MVDPTLADCKNVPACAAGRSLLGARRKFDSAQRRSFAIVTAVFTGTIPVAQSLAGYLAGPVLTPNGGILTTTFFFGGSYGLQDPPSCPSF